MRDPDTFAIAKLRPFSTTLWQWRSFARRYYSIACISHNTLSLSTPTLSSVPIAVPPFILTAYRTTYRTTVKTRASMILLP